MKTNGMGKRILIFALTAVIVLTMQGSRVFAESLQPESQSETSAGQPENRPETTEGQSGSQNNLPEEEQESHPATTGEESVSGNDLLTLQSENHPAVAAEEIDAKEYPELTDAILNDCIVTGVDPPGVTVNLFDYWQAEREIGGPNPDMEIAHDQAWYDENDNPFLEFFTYKMGISEEHLLRFGYTCVGCDDYCGKYGKFGAWNDSMTGGPCQGIVQNKLGALGYPELNLDTKSDKELGGYTKIPESEKYLKDEKKVENLSYLFSPSDWKAHEYREMYIGVQGLFQPDKDGYYYYNSTENFAYFNQATNSFILYNSPGVAEESTNKDSRGQFFPFNKAKDVFNTYTFDNGKYHLCYRNENDSVSIDGNSYLKCDARRLNHYLGMTLEFSFQQLENGCLSNKKPMTFEFTGDDDVWIFIDNVLVADLGGLHGPCSLEIDFSTGMVNVKKEDHTLFENHTLLDSYKAAYVEDSDLGGIAFRGNTFADDTEHTLKMFYLERGHGASDLALKFNVLPIPDEPVKEEPPNVPNEDNGKTDGTVETEEPATDPASENTSVAAESILSRSDDHMTLNMTGIPRTGDDSRIEWLIALCIISLSGIGIAVCNIIFVRRKKKNHSSKQ